jgi:ribosomal protein L40E
MIFRRLRRPNEAGGVRENIMALIVCKDCGKEFSTDAKRCPHCGAKKPRPKSRLGLLLLIIFLGLVAIGTLNHNKSPMNGGTDATNRDKARVTADGDPKNEGNDLLIRASPAKQAAMLASVVRSGPEGESCIGQTAFYQGKQDTKPPTPGKRRVKVMKGDEGSAFWSVRCTNGKAYQVMVRPNGSGNVMDCAVWAALLGRQECFRKY